MIELHTTDEVVEALGGTKAVAALFGRGDSAVSNWRKARRFPPYTYFVIRPELEKIGHSAPESLWSTNDARAET